MIGSASSSGNLTILPCDDFAGVAAGDGRVLARYFREVRDVIRECGADPDETLALYGIDPEAFSRPDQYIECVGALRMIEESSYRLGNPFLGLSLAERQGVGAYGYLVPLCQAAPDLRRALEAFTTYVPVVISPEGMFELLESRNAMEIRWDCDSELRQNRQGNFHGAAILIKFIRSIIGEDFRPDYVHLPACGSVSSPAGISDRFGCDVRFSAENHGSIVFSRDCLSRPVLERNVYAFHALERPLGAIKAQIEGDISARVAAYIRGRINAPTCNVEECAGALHISVRTLQKHLARMGTSFSGMLEAEKCEMAKAALRRSEVSLDDLAFHLGYAEQSTFGRAFRRWTGMSPGEFRRSVRQDRHEPSYLNAGKTFLAKVSA